MTSSRKLDQADPATALASYLDELLQTATDSAREDEVAAPAVALTIPARTPVVSAPAAKAELAPAPVVPKPAPPLPVSRLQEARVRNTPTPVVGPIAEQEQPPADAPPSVRPDWSEKPFECLIFRVAGLQLAVPLVLLGAIHRMEAKVKPIPGRPPWYMGMLPDRDHNLRVVDTAQWIMAGRVPEGAREGYQFVIRLDDSEWALACDDVAQSFTLDPNEVRWRSTRSKRPWLAGTVIKHMCALIDVGTMANLLARAEREHRLALE
ncbi:CheW domain-containing protein [Marinobacter caseinilyticus]|uniref:CheW domain-containing protein n=1 Tax=Marinobacter caseinilyticus TaxID=2692195 RepID=UPI00140E83C1|nr:CheW domain-containing protein [Marinobacter caseinilyticus]